MSLLYYLFLARILCLWSSFCYMGHHRCRPPVITDSTGEDTVLPQSRTVPHEMACTEPCMSTSTHDRSANIWPNILRLRMHEAMYVSQISLKGNIRTISPGRNRVNFQILAYLLTIDLLCGTGCLSYWFCYYMLWLDSSEMLPGSQRGEERTAILKPHADSAILTPATGAWNVGTGNDHVTPRDVRDQSRIAHRHVKTVNHSKLHIRMVNAFKYYRPSTDSGLDPFALILPNNPQYQLGR